MKPFILISLLFLALQGANACNDQDFAIVETNVESANLVFFDNKAAEFELKDQYDKTFTLNFPKNKATILVFGDREGAKQIESWVRPLVEKYADKIDIQGVAELSAVPSLARSVVRRIMKNQVKYSVMLDWSGAVSKSYGYQKGKANLFVIDKRGSIVAEVAGAASEAELEKIYREINRVF
jgi:peroxiredoxin